MLIIDYFHDERDPLQHHIYNEMCELYECTFSEKPNKKQIENSEYVYLGIYNHDVKNINDTIEQIKNKKVIIDQADDNCAIERYSNMNYDKLKYKVLLTRYNTKIFEDFFKNVNIDTIIFPWSININMFPKNINKTRDLCFMCFIKENRLKILNKLIDIRIRNSKLKFSCGLIFGSSYYKILNESKISIIECYRKCITQKYLESALSKNLIIGDLPIYPSEFKNYFENNIISVNFDSEKDLEEKILKYLNDEEERNKIVSRLNSIVLDKFDSNKIVPKYMQKICNKLDSI